MFSVKEILLVTVALLLIIPLSGCVSEGVDTVTNTTLEVEWTRVTHGCEIGCTTTDPAWTETENNYVYFSYSNATSPYTWLSTFSGDGGILNEINSPTGGWGGGHDIDSNYVYGLGDNVGSPWWRYDLDCLKSGSTGCGDVVFENLTDRDVFVGHWGTGTPVTTTSEQEALINYCHGDPYDTSYSFTEEDCGFWQCSHIDGRDIKSINNEQYIGVSYSCQFWNGSQHGDTEYCFRYLFQLDNSMNNYTWYINDSDYCTFPNEPGIKISDTDRTMVSDIYFSNNYAITSNGDKLWEIDSIPQSVVFDDKEYMYIQDGDYLKRIKPLSGNVKWKMNITAPKLNLTDEDPWNPSPDEFSYPCSFIEVGPWGETYTLCKRNRNVASSDEELYIVVINKFGELVSSNSYGNRLFMQYLNGNAEVSKNGDLLMSRRGIMEGDRALYSFTQNQTISTVGGGFNLLNLFPFLAFILSPFVLFLLYIISTISVGAVFGYYINGFIGMFAMLLMTLLFTLMNWIPAWIGVLLLILLMATMIYFREFLIEAM